MVQSGGEGVCAMGAAGVQATLNSVQKAPACAKASQGLASHFDWHAVRGSFDESALSVRIRGDVYARARCLLGEAEHRLERTRSELLALGRSGSKAKGQKPPNPTATKTAA